MIVINYVVASQYHKNPYAYKVYKKSSECSQQISRFRSECKNKENSGKWQKALRSMDAQIDISEYKNTEKDYNAYDTVIISEIILYAVTNATQNATFIKTLKI